MRVGPHEISGKAVYDAIRTARHTYIEYGTGERELFDLQQDPYQLTNRAATADAGLLQVLSERLVELKNCASTNCRELEDLQVEPEPTPVALSEDGAKG